MPPLRLEDDAMNRNDITRLTRKPTRWRVRSLQIALDWLLIALSFSAVVGAGEPGAAGPNPEPSVGPRSAEPRYLVFWWPPRKAAQLASIVGTRGNGRTRLLGFGKPISTFDEEDTVRDQIRAIVQAARQNDLAFMLQFDFHVFWKSRPDLWNWFDPGQPGFNPDNKRNVEWFGWGGPPARHRYLNWGVPERIAPPMCFTSPAIRAEVTRLVSRVIAPTVREELAALERDGKSRLFAGVLVGAEPGFDNYTRTDPETAKMIKADGATPGQLGYRSLLDRGYGPDRPPADLRRALAEVVQETVAFWCRQFVDAGLPAAKLYPHVAAAAPPEMMCAPAWTAFNVYSRPGWTTYPVGPLAVDFQSLYDELARHGNPPWAGVEANAGFPGSMLEWEPYLARHFNHGAVVVGINIGATGSELPVRLRDSAFSAQALAAYRKFLGGGELIDAPIPADHPQLRVQRKMKAVQAAIQAEFKAGRDPSAVGHELEQKLPPLMQSGDLAAAEALLDDALRRLGAAAPATDAYGNPLDAR
ncbi:MAG: hypothetical protein M1457_03480 [bacterium]|nr:hypothetical protein [bacterium]